VDEAKAKIFAFSDAVRGGIEAAFEHLAPVMQRVGPALRAVADVLSRVFTPAWEALKPLLKSGLELWERLSILASESLAPALRLIEPILTLIAKAMTAVFQETAKLVDKLNELAGFALNPIKIGVEHTLGNALSNATAGGGGGPAPTTQPVNALTINGNLNVTGGKSLAREIADFVAYRFLQLSKETMTGGGVSAYDWVKWARGGTLIHG
jgi:hypothetical protein